MKLRLRQHKRVAMGLSHVAGWGAFAQVPLTLASDIHGVTLLRKPMEPASFDIHVITLLRQKYNSVCRAYAHGYSHPTVKSVLIRLMYM